MLTPVDALLQFLSSRSERDREWLLVKLSFELDEKVQAPEKLGDIGKWLTTYLYPGVRHSLKFGRLVGIIAFLDFELSSPALARSQGMAEGMAQSDQDWMSAQGKNMLDDIVPRQMALSEAWRDARTHELDEASLWIYHDDLLVRREPQSRAGDHG